MLLEPDDYLRVRQLPLFESVQADAFARLCEAGILQRAARGAQFTRQGDVDGGLYVLLEGGVEIESDWHDRGSTLALLKPLSVFGLASAILGEPELTTARAIAPSRVLMFPGNVFREAVRRDPALSFAAARALSGCYCGVVRALKNHKLRGALQRLASYLLSQQRRQGGKATLTLPCQKRVLSSLLGMTPENLSRAFASLGPYGVKVDGAFVTLSRPEALTRLAVPDVLMDGYLAHEAQAGDKPNEDTRRLLQDRSSGLRE